MLTNKTAENLYHNFAKNLPIIDYHCHLPPDEIAQNRKFRNIDETTDVLSFPMQEEKRTDAPFVDPPDEILRLGDILISYPQVVEDASVENKLVDEKIDELIRHSMDHLLGIHHE